MSTINQSSKQVSTWLLIGVGMTVIQIALGGITRLTGSGLSITQWEVITGALPPLNAQQWMEEFNKYKQTPQFQLLNFDFTLSNFKFIFFWEWFHRLWGRAIGFVFLIGFVGFLINKSFKKEMITPFIVLFVLGALQGLIGWIMVASGLTGDAVYVKPTRLAMHFTMALLLLCYTCWFAFQLRIDPTQRFDGKKLRQTNLLLLVLLFVQLLYGALMAGHKAANIAATWPTINGDWIPGTLFSHQPLLLNFIDNTILVHFIHRGLAYLILFIIIVWSVRLFKTNGTKLFNSVKKWPLIIVWMQVLLGIASIISSAGIIPGKWGLFEWMAQLHQLGGMMLLLSLIMVFYITSGKSNTN